MQQRLASRHIVRLRLPLHVDRMSLIRLLLTAFPAQLKQRPGLVTLTPSMIFFTPLLSSSPTISIPLADVTGVKKSSLMKGIEMHAPLADGGGFRSLEDIPVFSGEKRSLSTAGKKREESADAAASSDTPAIAGVKRRRSPASDEEC